MLLLAMVLTHRAILEVICGPNAVEQPEQRWTLIAGLRKKIEPGRTGYPPGCARAPSR